jgi:hypothetical protein
MLDFFRRKRSKIEDYFTEDRRRPQSTREYVSPSGRYRLVVESYATSQGCWDFTRGLVFDDELTGKPIPQEVMTKREPVADVKRNYSSFWHAFVTHPNGREYLLCGEDYQGYSCIDLAADWPENRVDYLPETAQKGAGFCWADCTPDTDTSPPKLIVEGCYWACPYEKVMYDFSNPMQLPYPELSREPLHHEEEDDEDEEEDEEE